MLMYLRLFKESFSFAINALTNNKLRTFLSLLGVTIGIFSIIAILAAVDSLDQNIKGQLEGLDKNTMYVTKYSFGPTTIPRWQRENFPQTDHEDFVYLERTLPDVDAMAYVIFGRSESIKFEGKTIYIGCFTCLIKAAKAYDAKANELFREFARPNFPIH